MTLFQRRFGLGNELVVQRLFQAMVLRLAVVDRYAGLGRDLMQNLRQVDALRFPMRQHALSIDAVHAADHLVEAPEPEFCHDLAHFLSDEEEIVYYVLRRAGEFLAQHGILCGDPDRTRIQVTFAHHDAAQRDQRRCGETEFIGAQQRTDGHVTPGAQPPVHLDGDTPAQSIQHERLLRFRKADFPRRPSMGKRCQRRSTGAAFITCDRDMVGARLRDTGGHGSDAHFRNQFHRDTRARIGVFQIVNELGQILDRVDVMMRRR